MLLCAKDLSFSYENGKPIFKNINLTISNTEKVAIFAPSGFGKSTLAKILSGYEKPTSGIVMFDNEKLPKFGFCPVQLIFQHPEKSVNPKWKIGKILNEGGAFDEGMLDRLSIPKEYLNRFPSEVSGGELQRICIARALKDSTKFIIADEITTMLDTITQAQIWDFVLEEVDKRNIGLLVITHNEFLAKRICTKIIDFTSL